MDAPDVDYVYRRAAAELERLVKSGRWAYGEKIPDRTELAVLLGTGEMTARRTAAMLADPERPGGPMLRKLPGSGTFVIWRQGT